MRQHSQFLLNKSHIEIQGRKANDIKQSASWEATQAFLEIFPSIVCVLLFVLVVGWFSVSFHNREFLLAVCFQGSRTKVMWRIRSRNSLQRLQGVTNCTRGGFLLPWNIVENSAFWPFL